MLGDTGVAVHPDDPRYAHLVGKTVRLPLVGRSIPIVADAYADPDEGDRRGQDHPGARLQRLGGRRALRARGDQRDGHAGAIVDRGQRRLPRGRGRVRRAGRPPRARPLRGARPRSSPSRTSRAGSTASTRRLHIVPHGDRSKVAIEPFLTDQWYVDAAKLAVPALAAVRDGRTRILPEQYEKIYFHWLENIEPWCISRQLWWGHQIPVWYGDYLDEKASAAQRQAAPPRARPCSPGAALAAASAASRGAVARRRRTGTARASASG